MSTYLATLCYEGTHYFGWQKTKYGPSIQGELERAIEQVTQEKSLPEAASRTDRGVHAVGQRIAFSLQKQWDAARLQKALNAMLPFDIRIIDMQQVSTTFHPTLDAKEKEYRYFISLGAVQVPHQRLFSWHFCDPLDMDAMREAAHRFLGTHDFSALANEAEQEPICTVHKIEWSVLVAEPSTVWAMAEPNVIQNPITQSREHSLQLTGQLLNHVRYESKEEGDHELCMQLQITLVADRFLYKMARNLVGTLLYIGCGKLPRNRAQELLCSKDRRKKGVTAPAHGLFLHQVRYTTPQCAFQDRLFGERF